MTDQVARVRVNLVDQEGWKAWDPAGDISSYAFDNSADMFRAYRDNSSEEWVRDILSAKGIVKPSDDVFDETEALAEAMSGQDLEESSRMVLDAGTWAWEEAYVPEDNDIEYAMSDTVDHVLEESTFYEGDEELWAPLLSTGSRAPLESQKKAQDWSPTRKWDPSLIVKDLLSHVTYERQPDHYDRYLVFNFQKSEAVKALLDKARHGRGLPFEEMLGRLGPWLQDLANEYVSKFFKRLEKNMEHVDIAGRVDFDKHWKTILKDESTVVAAQKEMLEYLKEKGDLQENQARLVATIILKLAKKGRLSAEAAAELHGPENALHHHAQTMEEAAEIMGFSRGQIERYLGGKKRRGL